MKLRDQLSFAINHMPMGDEAYEYLVKCIELHDEHVTQLDCGNPECMTHLGTIEPEVIGSITLACPKCSHVTAWSSTSDD